MSAFDATLAKRAVWVTFSAGVYAAVVGLVVMISLIAGRTWLSDISPAGIIMKVNTALISFAAGVSLLLLSSVHLASSPHAYPRIRYGSVRVLSTLIIVIGVLTLAEHITGLDFKIDQLIISELPGSPATTSPGRMGPHASVSYSLIGLSILLLTYPAGSIPRRWPSRIGTAASLISATAAMCAIVAYLYGADILFGVAKYTGISLLTATVLFLSSIGLLILRSECEPVRSFFRAGSSSAMARLGLAAFLIIPIALGWLRNYGRINDWWDRATGTALLITFLVCALLAITWYMVSALSLREDILAQRDRLLTAVTDHSHVGLVIVNARHEYLYANRAYAQILRLPTHQIIGQRVPDVLPVPYDSQIRPRLERAFRGEHVQYILELPIHADDSQPHSFSVNYEPQFVQGEVVTVVVAIADITMIRRAESEKLRQAELVRTIAENSSACLFLLDARGHCTYINKAGEIMFGWTFAELRDHPLHKLIRRAEDGHFNILAQFSSDRLHTHAVREHAEILFRRSGVPFPVIIAATPVFDDSGNRVSTVVEVRDVTVQRAHEDELTAHRERLEHLVAERTRQLEAAQGSLRRTERLAAMGTLAAGLGHDLGNLMLPLRIRLDALNKMDLSAAARDEISSIMESMNYLQRLASSLRQMAADPDAKAPAGGTDLTSWWNDSQGMIRAVVPRGVQLQHNFAPDLPAVNAASAALTQAIFNLVQNSAEALSRRSGPGLEKTIMVGARKSQRVNGVALFVTDNGEGMTAEVAARCFEPYFSTKDRIIATGLGLALVRGVAEASGGSIECQSAPGAGSTFTLHLPFASPGTRSPQSPVITAIIDVRDARTAALATMLLKTLNVNCRNGNGKAPADGELWITEIQLQTELESFLDDRPDSRSILLIASNLESAPANPAISHSTPSPAELRQAIKRIAEKLHQSARTTTPAISASTPAIARERSPLKEPRT